MRSIGVFGEPACKCTGVCTCVYVCERYSPNGTKLWLGVLSISTVPPRARWTYGMRYIIKPKQNRSGKEEKAQQALQWGSQPPLRTEVCLQNVLEIQTEECLLYYPNKSPSLWITLLVSTKIPQDISNPDHSSVPQRKIRSQLEPTSGMYKVKLRVLPTANAPYPLKSLHISDQKSYMWL